MVQAWVFWVMVVVAVVQAGALWVSGERRARAVQRAHSASRQVRFATITLEGPPSEWRSSRFIQTQNEAEKAAGHWQVQDGRTGRTFCTSPGYLSAEAVVTVLNECDGRGWIA